MAPPIVIHAEPLKNLSGPQERDLLCQALANRDSMGLRIRLAQLHTLLDEFAEAIALLAQGGPPESFDAAHAIAGAYLGRGEEGDPEAALAAARHAETLADGAIARATALVDQARALLAADRKAEAAEAFAAALEIDPANGTALRSLCTPLFDAQTPEKVLEICDTIDARGVAHTQLLGLRTLALAQLGRRDEARALAGFDRFLSEIVPPAPEGWNDLPAFNAAVAQELLHDPAVRNGRHGTASIATQRIDEPACAATPAMRALQQLILDHVRTLIDALGPADHPWLHQRPAAAMLRMWCVMTRSEGFERWHMHPAGWASGGYYVAVPESVARGNSTAGCLEFGVPERFVGEAAAQAMGTRLLRPRAGLLTLFPSQAYHRTHPHGADGVRICVAFDVIPL